MRLRGKIERLENLVYGNKFTILISHTKEESKRKVAEYCAENPDGPAPIVIIATKIVKSARTGTNR